MAKIAVDGPAGSGKSTLARLLAARLGFTYVDTGAMYRACTLLVIRTGTDPENGKAVLEACSTADIRLEGSLEEQKVLLDGEDVTREIRSPRVTGLVSRVAAHSGLRQEMLKRQQQMARHTDVVMDGRDIGTAVLPDADIKFFVTASLEERAARRMGDFSGLGHTKTGAELMEEIAGRDREDMSREASPLRQPEDAVVVDTTGKSVEESLEELLDHWQRRNKGSREKETAGL